MHKKQLVITTILLIIFAIFGWFALKAILTWFQSLNAPVAAAFATALIGLIGLWYAQWQSKSREISESHRESKIAVYNNFFDIVEKFTGNQNEDNAEEISEEWIKSEFTKLNHRGLILWASAEVITAWLQFRVAATTAGQNILVTVDSMYQAIRKDLDHSNYSLKKGDLIKINLSNPHEWDEQIL